MRRSSNKKMGNSGQQKEQRAINQATTASTSSSSGGNSPPMQSFTEQSSENSSTMAMETDNQAVSTVNTAVQQRFTLKSWSGVAFWAWDTVVENCAICRNLIIDVCIECQPSLKQAVKEGSQGVDEEGNCRIAWGVCQHAFHFHCINRWVKTRQVCPLDNRPWQFLAQ